jgi:multidrug efflux pump subunit AcrA (membrane-fusion protein)
VLIYLVIVVNFQCRLGIAGRARSKQEVQIWTNEQAIPTVTLVQLQQGPSEGELRLPGNVSAFYAGKIYARVSGYLKDWSDDIGAHVKKGQVLAVINAPDLDQQFAQARADLIRAQADEQLAQVTYDRWKILSKQNIVSQQAKDERSSYGRALLPWLPFTFRLIQRSCAFPPRP